MVRVGIEENIVKSVVFKFVMICDLLPTSSPIFMSSAIFVNPNLPKASGSLANRKHAEWFKLFLFLICKKYALLQFQGHSHISGNYYFISDGLILLAI